MTYKDLYTTTSGTLCQRGAKTVRATIGMFWRNNDPSSVSINVRAGESHEVWTVGRSLFIAAGLDWYRGAWAGGGDFGVCYAGDRVMLAFKPTDRPREHVIVIAPAAPFEDFIQHTVALVEPGDPECAINMEHVDKAIERILGADRG